MEKYIKFTKPLLPDAGPDIDIVLVFVTTADMSVSLSVNVKTRFFERKNISIAIHTPLKKTLALIVETFPDNAETNIQ